MSMGKAHALREAASRSALGELILRPPPRMPGRIPVHPDTDGAAILARVMAEPPVDDDDGDQSRSPRTNRAGNESGLTPLPNGWP